MTWTVCIGRDEWVNIFKKQTQDYYLAILKTFIDIFNKMNVLWKHHTVKKSARCKRLHIVSLYLCKIIEKAK